MADIPYIVLILGVCIEHSGYAIEMMHQPTVSMVGPAGS